jgi:hypothetical protein
MTLARRTSYQRGGVPFGEDGRCSWRIAIARSGPGRGHAVAEHAPLQLVSESIVLPDGDVKPQPQVPGYRPISAACAISPSVSVVIPAMNEAPNLPHVFDSMPEWVDEIVLVDGHSVDGTAEVTRRLRPDVKIVAQSGRGKGDALIAGFAACRGDIIVTIDADGSSDGREVVRFVTALASGADYAKGSRFTNGGGSDDITVTRRCGNWFLSRLVNLLFGTHYTDLCYGYNAFWARHLFVLGLDTPGFEVETVMNIRAAQAGLMVQEIPSHEHARLHGSSNLNAIRDGWQIAKVILREKRGGLTRNDTANGASFEGPISLRSSSRARDSITGLPEADGSGNL